MPTIKISPEVRARLQALKQPVARTGNYTKAQQERYGSERLETFGEVVERLLTAQTCTQPPSTTPADLGTNPAPPHPSKPRISSRP